MAAACLVALVCVLVTWSVVPARAHTEVARAEPGPAETVDTGVDRVLLEFLDPVLPGVSITVADPDGRPVEGLGAPTQSDGNLRAEVNFAPLGIEGAYVVEYVFTAEDGDQQRDRYRFTVAADDGGVAARAVLAIGAALVVFASVMGIAFWRRRHAT